MYDSFIKKLDDFNLEVETDAEGNVIENADLRRINYLLHFKNVIERQNYQDSEDKTLQQRLHSMTEMMRNLESDPAQRDMLLKLSGLSQRYSILQELSGVGQLKELLNHCTTLSVNEFNRCLGEDGFDGNDV